MDADVIVKWVGVFLVGFSSIGMVITFFILIRNLFREQGR